MTLIEFLDGAELQVESVTQRAELTRVLRDLVDLKPSELAKKLYADYEGKPAQWTAAEVLRAYFCSSTPAPTMAELIDQVGNTKIKKRLKEVANVLAAKCTHHPGRDSVAVVYGKNYCQQCSDGIKAARTKVDKHVEPKDCFVIYQGADKWAPITGTGCAHWVAHQQGISKGEKCLDNKTIKVTELVSGLTAYGRENAKVDDIWASSALDHCGLVISVTATGGSPPNTIMIRHDSSAQGGVVTNDFDEHFKRDGKFHR